ncbi:MAG TPA: hypothetical protein VJ203_01770 [Bacteroidales bacterium]|nr:hypothetical protein [Bacteroidales bacterium]
MTVPELPHWLIIAGTGRDSGKTSFACSLINQFKGKVPLVALKISPHRHRLALGGRIIVDKDFLYISEETDPQTGKDSSRMLAAGADRSFLIIAADEELAGAIEKIQSMAGAGTYYICESGGLRRYVNPGLFMMISCHGENERKTDPFNLKALADVYITCSEKKIDFDLDRIIIADNRWKIRQDHDTL